MRILKYSILFVAAFYLIGMACNYYGMEDSAQTGIYILFGVMAVLGFFISGRK